MRESERSRAAAQLVLHKQRKLSFANPFQILILIRIMMMEKFLSWLLWPSPYNHLAQTQVQLFFQILMMIVIIWMIIGHHNDIVGDDDYWPNIIIMACAVVSIAVLIFFSGFNQVSPRPYWWWFQCQWYNFVGVEHPTLSIIFDISMKIGLCTVLVGNICTVTSYVTCNHYKHLEPWHL